MPHIISTLSNDQEYVVWDKPDLDGARTGRAVSKKTSVIVKGKANVATKLLTPEGVVTSVTDHEIELLRDNKVFQVHEKNGHLKIVRFAPANVEKEARKDMKDRDESAPLSVTKGDFKAGGRAAGLPPMASKIE